MTAALVAPLLALSLAAAPATADGVREGERALLRMVFDECAAWARGQVVPFAFARLAPVPGPAAPLPVLDAPAYALAETGYRVQWGFLDGRRGCVVAGPETGGADWSGLGLDPRGAIGRLGARAAAMGMAGPDAGDLAPLRTYEWTARDGTVLRLVGGPPEGGLSPVLRASVSYAVPGG